MMSLFEETKNPLFNLICQIVNEIQAGAKLTRKDIKQKIYEMKQFQYLEAPDFEREEEIIDLMFKFQGPNDYAAIPFNEPVPNLITQTELSWLKTVLMDKDTAFLIAENFRVNLLEKLEDIPPLYNPEIWQKLHFKSNESSSGLKYNQTLTLIVEVLRDRKTLCRQTNGQEEIIIPYRLEYDLFNDRYALLTWNENIEVAEKIFLEDLSYISSNNKPIPENIESKLQNFFLKHEAKITLLLRKTRNAVERCFELFGSYDKQARIQNDGTYLLTIKYYDFDEEEVIERILSLGAAVTVIDPESIRKKIINRLIEIRKLYK